MKQEKTKAGNKILTPLLIAYILFFVTGVVFMVLKRTDFSAFYASAVGALISIPSAVGIVLLMRMRRPGFYFLCVSAVIFTAFAVFWQIRTGKTDLCIAAVILVLLVFIAAYAIFICDSHNETIWEASYEYLDYFHFKHIYQLSCILALCVAFVCLNKYMQSKHIEPKPKPLPPGIEEVFANAKGLMNSDVKDSVAKGLLVMDNLSSKGYIPAIYEMAYTYGWYEDSRSVKRKEILGIEVLSSKSDYRYLPTSSEINDTAKQLFKDIADRGDTSYADINAESLFRLANYFTIQYPDLDLIQDPDIAIDYYNQALVWAEKSKNAVLKDKIERNRNMVNDFLKKKKR